MAGPGLKSLLELLLELLLPGESLVKILLPYFRTLCSNVFLGFEVGAGGRLGCGGGPGSVIEAGAAGGGRPGGGGPLGAAGLGFSSSGKLHSCRRYSMIPIGLPVRIMFLVWGSKDSQNFFSSDVIAWSYGR